MIFLNEPELFELTGYVRNADRCRWLKSHGFKYEIAATGKPVVLRSHLESKMSDQGSKAQEEWRPNLAAMKKVA